MGSSTRSMMMAKLHLGLSIVMGIFQVDQQPTSSIMMAELNLGLSMGMGCRISRQQLTSSILNVRAPSCPPPWTWASNKLTSSRPQLQIGYLARTQLTHDELAPPWPDFVTRASSNFVSLSVSYGFTLLATFWFAPYNTAQCRGVSLSSSKISQNTKLTNI